MFVEGVPIFAQLAEQLASDVLVGRYHEGDQVPSINELAAYYRINPATANRAVAGLVERGILVKQRGIGMFVAAGARDKIAAERRDGLVTKYVTPLIAEARALGLSADALVQLIEKEAHA